MKNSRDSGESGNPRNSKKSEENDFSFDEIWNRPDMLSTNQNREFR